MKTIKIFLASAGALKDERTQLELLVGRENKVLIPQGVHLDFVVWEQQSLAFSKGPKQQDFTDSMLESEIVICLVFDKIGPFTYEEFQKAYKGFSNGSKPKKLYVFLKDAPISSMDISEDFKKVIRFKKEIQKYQQVYGTYTTVSNLWMQVKRNLDQDLPELTKESVGETLVNLLNQINPQVHQQFLAGQQEVRVMVGQTNLPILRKLNREVEGQEVFKIHPTGATIMGGTGNRIGDHINDLEEGMMSGFTITRLSNYPFTAK